MMTLSHQVPTRTSQIFISYGREDVGFARDLRERLLAFGHQPWMDLFDIPPGARWPTEIDRALRDSSAVLGLMSPAAFQSENVMNEWDWAIANNRRLILLLIEPCEIPFQYVSRNYLDFTSERAAAFTALLQAIGAPRADVPASVEQASEAAALPALKADGLHLRPNTAVVGRDDEIGQLHGHLQAALQSDGSLVLLAGEAGIGKTTLSAILCREAVGAGALVLNGGCYDLATTPPYGPWIEVLGSYPGGNGLPTLPDQLRAGGGMAGIDSQAALFDLAGRFLAGVASARPLVLVVEDLHWADPASLDLLRYLSRTLRDYPVLLLATYRDDEVTREHLLAPLLPALVREGRTHRLHLQRLDRGAVLAIVRERYRLSTGDEERLTAYLERLAEGNPFFTNELLFTLEEHRLLAPAAGGWRLGDLTRAGVPSLIRQVIDGRLTRLNAAARNLLDIAAVIGHEVRLDLLQELYEGSTANLDAALRQAIEHHLLLVQPDQRSVRFHHALVRQAIYAAIPVFSCQALHRQAGDLLTGRARPDPAVVASHFYEAGDERALDWLVQAAERAESLFAPNAVVAECVRALTLAERLEIEAPLTAHRLRGRAREMTGEFAGARTDHETALQLARDRGDQHAEWQALIDLGMLWSSRDYQRVGEYYEQALERAKQIGDPSTLANTHNWLGNWLANVARLAESEQHHLEALDIVQQVDDRGGIAATYNLLGTSTFIAGHLVQSGAYYDKAIALFRELDDQLGLAQALGNLSLCGGAKTSACFVDPNRRRLAIAASDEARRIARETGWRAVEAYTFGMSSQPRIVQGDYQEALDFSRHALKIAEEIAHSQWICYSRLNLSDTYRDLLVPELARTYLEPAVALGDTTGSIIWSSWPRCSLTLTYIDLGIVDRAEALIHERPAPGKVEISISHLYQLFTEAAVARARGDPEAALTIVERLIASDPAGRGDEVPMTLNLLGDILIDLGRFEAAETTLEASKDHAAKLGYRPYLWRALASLGRLHQAWGQLKEAAAARASALTVIDDLASQLDDEKLRATFLENARTQVPGATPYTPDRQSASPYVGLTPREIEVIRLVARGLTDAEIGEQLFISPRTVSQHLRSIYNKLEVTNRTAAVHVATEHKLL